MSKLVQRGFSLIELLVVVAIIALLAAIALPIYQQYTVRAKVMSVIPTLDSIMTQMMNYQQSHGNFPTPYQLGMSGAVNGQPTLSNPTFMGPYVTAVYTLDQCNSAGGGSSGSTGCGGASCGGKLGLVGVIFSISGTGISNVAGGTVTLFQLECPTWYVNGAYVKTNCGFVVRNGAGTYPNVSMPPLVNGDVGGSLASWPTFVSSFNSISSCPK